MRFVDPTILFTINSSNFSATQESDAGTTNYVYDSSNVKSCSQGFGVSMNLYDAAVSKITCTVTGIFGSGKDPFTVYGTYQHATSTLSLSDSQKYTIAAGGMGNVLSFTSSSVKAKYDNTQGLSVTGSLYDQ